MKSIGSGSEEFVKRGLAPVIKVLGVVVQRGGHYCPFLKGMSRQIYAVPDLCCIVSRRSVELVGVFSVTGILCLVVVQGRAGE